MRRKEEKSEQVTVNSNEEEGEEIVSRLPSIGMRRKEEKSEQVTVNRNEEEGEESE
jgi:hypothetical protein